MSADESEESWQTGDRARASRGRRPEMRVLSRTLPRFLAAHRAGGRDTDALLAELGLALGSDQLAAVEIALEPLRTATDRIAEELREPTLGLRLAQSLPATAMGLVELALRAAPTLNEGLERFGRYGALFCPLEQVELAVRGDEAELAHRVPGTRRALGRQGNELFVAWLVRTIREVLGQAWSPTEVAWPDAAPPEGPTPWPRRLRPRSCASPWASTPCASPARPGRAQRHRRSRPLGHGGWRAERVFGQWRNRRRAGAHPQRDPGAAPARAGRPCRPWPRSWAPAAHPAASARRAPRHLQRSRRGDAARAWQKSSWRARGWGSRRSPSAWATPISRPSSAPSSGSPRSPRSSSASELGQG